MSAVVEVWCPVRDEYDYERYLTEVDRSTAAPPVPAPPIEWWALVLPAAAVALLAFAAAVLIWRAAG